MIGCEPLKPYNELFEEVDGASARKCQLLKALLEQHRSFVQEQIQNWQGSLEKLDDKIEW
ncbi:hypothetical protein DHL47_10200 [Streptococcus panodentis]|uniref:Uncharacterized protein n=1 Tax=Streptococcus panodentis TaxID=1581472 RepID=A0ABS5AYS6_9STRE|nr:hypothetical protein [Streptococcus panodentis]